MLDSLLANVLRLKSGHGSRNVSVICTHAVAQYWLFPRLLRFNAQHPELTVNIHASNEMGESTVADYDFGVLYGHGRWRSLQADKLFDECIYPIVSTQRALPPADSLAALQALPLIQLDAAHGSVQTIEGRYAGFAALVRADGSKWYSPSVRIARGCPVASTMTS